MSGGTIYRCPECSRLVIFGQTCTCGKQTSRPSSAATVFEPDARPHVRGHGSRVGRADRGGRNGGRAVSELTELPDWLWALLDALAEYEHDHPPLYRFADDPTDGKPEYVRAQCFGSFLSERKAWPPREIWDAAEFRRHVLRNSTTDSGRDGTAT